MKAKTIVPLALLAAVVVVAAAAFSQAGSTAADGLFAELRKGQSVRLIDAGGSYEIQTYSGSLSGTRTIVEVGSDYLAVEDTKNNVIRIPVYSVKSVTIRR